MEEAKTRAEKKNGVAPHETLKGGEENEASKNQ